MGNTYAAYLDPRPLYNYACEAVSALRSPEYSSEKVAEAISKLQSTLQYLDGKIEIMNACTQRYTSEGKRLYRIGNKSGALHQMRLRKMYQREITKIESIKFNIESNILNLESLSVMMETVSTVKDTSTYVQLINRNVDVERLEGMIEDLSEQRDTAHDIESILSQTHDEKYDEDELLRELEELGSEELTPADAAPADATPADAAPGGASVASPGVAVNQPPASPRSPRPPTDAGMIANELPVAPTHALSCNPDERRKSNNAPLAMLS